LLANGLGKPAIWFTLFGNGVAGLVNKPADVTIRIVSLAIWLTGLAIRFAGLAN